MFQDKLQSQRFELKYIVPEPVALAAREFVRCHLKLDDYCVDRPDFSYAIHSLYLDSDDLTLYGHTINGNKNRFKLRLRFYNDNPTAPVFAEIKRRVNNAILKQRCAIKRDAVSSLLQGRMPPPAQMVSQDPRHLIALERFLQLTLDTRAKPKAHVAYRREAWLSPHDNSVRVTMDRDVRFEVQQDAHLCTQMHGPASVFGSKVVLEIKFTGRFPEWMRDFVRSFGLTQCSAAKYADGVTVVGENRFGRMPSLRQTNRRNAVRRTLKTEYASNQAIKGAP